jgi:hypothetical protein
MQRVKDIKAELQKWAEALDKAFKSESEQHLIELENASKRVENSCDLLGAELAEIDAMLEEAELSSVIRQR